MATTLFSQNIIACIWDFDKTLIPGYMQSPLLKRYEVDETSFWAETNGLDAAYRRRGYHISSEIAYLNHLLTHARSGQMRDLNNRILKECGADLEFYPGLPEFFDRSRQWVEAKPNYRKHGIELEHYVVSTGLAEIIRGSAVANKVDGIWACEFVENPLKPGFLTDPEQPISAEATITQIGRVIDNTTKTRAIFEINKGTNRNPAIDVNSTIAPEDRRIPMQNMIYIADGPSDIPSFSIVKKGGGLAYAVYNPDSDDEYQQVDKLRSSNRVDHFGEADYRSDSQTCKWLSLQVGAMGDRIVAESEAAVAKSVARPPRHLQKDADHQRPQGNPAGKPRPESGSE